MQNAIPKGIPIDPINKPHTLKKGADQEKVPEKS